MVAVLVVEGAGGGAGKSAVAQLTNSDGGPTIMSFPVKDGDYLRGFRIRGGCDIASTTAFYRWHASVGDFQAKTSADVFRSGAPVMIDSVDASGGTDWFPIGPQSGDFYVHINHLAHGPKWLNLEVRTDDATAIVYVVVSVDIVPAEIMNCFLGGGGLV